MGGAIRRLADLAPNTPRPDARSVHVRNGAVALRALADDYDRRVRQAMG